MNVDSAFGVLMTGVTAACVASFVSLRCRGQKTQAILYLSAGYYRRFVRTSSVLSRMLIL